MRFMKKVVAFTMAVMLLIPSVAVNAEEPQVLGVQAVEQPSQEPTAADTNTGTDEKKDNEAPAVGDTADENAVQPEKKQENASEAGKDAPEAEAQEEEKLPEEEQVQGEEEEALPENGASEEGKLQDIENVQFNTGDHVWTIVNEDDFNTYEYGDGYFEEDGSYTINIPELNPFFPYEVQFTSNGKTENKWFQSPDDTVEVGGHTFKVAANFDGTGITQMSMEVAGDTVVIYPEEKTFTNDGDGVQEMSLIPLKHVSLGRISLEGYSPLELTMVKVNAIINKSNDTNRDTVDISDSTKVAWKYEGDNNDFYTLTAMNDTIDLSHRTSSGVCYWELVVGDGDQLNPDNIRYTLPIGVTDSEKWLEPVVYVEDEIHKRLAVDLTYSYKSGESDYCYRDTYEITEKGIQRDLITKIPLYAENTYVSFNMQKGLFTNSEINSVKILEGTYRTKESVSAALSGKDITSKIMCSNMNTVSAGYKLPHSKDNDSQVEDELALTMVGYDAQGNVKGILPFTWKITQKNTTKLTLELCEKGTTNSVLYSYGNGSSGRIHYISEEDKYKDKGSSWLDFRLADKYSVEGTYTFTMEYSDTSSLGTDIVAVYPGKYATIEAAQAAGAENIKDKIVGEKGQVQGYDVSFGRKVSYDGSEDAYSDSIITIFVGQKANPTAYVFRFLTFHSSNSGNTLSSACELRFVGLKDSSGKELPTYAMRQQDDSYEKNNYITYLVDENFDLNQKYAPVFTSSAKSTVYAAGSSSKEVSGETLHSFANGALQYTVYAEDGTSQNYWLQVKKADSSYGQLYINSLADANANTRMENGVVYSTREVMLDKYYDYVHNICLVNIGKADIPELSAELSSDTVELDPYWTLNGKQSLSAMGTIDSTFYWGELPNLAKVRLRAKEGVKDGTEISGTLTIKSAGKVLMVLNLTGMVGDPCITTESIPDAVKYVPYGTAIQNSNKYKWITVKYSHEGGNLPAGMVIKENGELYGTPQETGTFHFTVKAEFTAHGRSVDFDDKTADFTLTVKDNTNDNVYNESDIADGYILETSIGNETSAGSHDFYLPEITDSLFVSKGIYPNFVDLWLNGEKLVRGVDYDAASGSTRITISAQTLQNKALKTGVNTIAAEFRDGGAANFAKDNDPKNALKRTAQNFRLDKTDADGGNGGGGHSHGSSDDGDDAGSGAGKGVTISGYLVDGSGNPISGMTVELHSTPRTTVTAQNGFFRFTNVEFGQHELFAKDSDGNILASKKFELRSGKTVGFAGNVLSAPAGSAVVMTVKVADGNMTFSNVRRGNPQTGDHANTAMWLLLMAGSCAVLAGLAAYRKRRSAR